MSAFFTLSAESLDAADRILKRLHQDQRLRSSLILDTAGFVLLSEGKFTFLPAEEVGAIVAATYSALNALASMTAAKDLTVKFHDSPLGAVMMSGVTSRILLVLIFDEVQADETILRHRAEEVARTLRVIFEADTSSMGLHRDSPPISSVRFIEDKLGELFHDIEER